MTLLQTRLPGLLVIEAKLYRDDRGHFSEVWNEARYAELGLPTHFVQDNVSRSEPGVVRGLHFQHPNGQGKLVGVLQGEVVDVALDIRVGSPTFGRWEMFRLSASEGRQVFIPPGFAHGFAVIGEEPALFWYKCTHFYDPRSEGTVRWDDPDLAIPWGIAAPRLSPKDRSAPRLAEAAPESLPRYSGP